MKMNKKLIVGNMKMNPVSPIEADRYLNMLEKNRSSGLPASDIFR